MLLISLGLLGLLYTFTGGYWPPDLVGLALPMSGGLIVVGVFFRLYLQWEKEAALEREKEEQAREEAERGDWWSDQR